MIVIASVSVLGAVTVEGMYKIAGVNCPWYEPFNSMLGFSRTEASSSFDICLPGVDIAEFYGVPLAAIVGFLAGLLLSFFAELLEKKTGRSW